MLTKKQRDSQIQGYKNAREDLIKAISNNKQFVPGKVMDLIFNSLELSYRDRYFKK